MTTPELAIFLVGTVVGAFVSGLSGFAFGLVTLAVWVWLLPLAELTPLVLFGSLGAQLVAIPRVWPEADWQRLRPMLAIAVLGVPLGVLLIPYVSLESFRIAFGVLLIGFSLLQLFASGSSKAGEGARVGDSLVAFASSILGGLAGLSGVLLVAWGVVRAWEMRPFRAVLTLFNSTCQVIGLTVLAVAGGLTPTTLLRFAIMAPCLAVGAWLGVRALDHVSPEGFRRLVLILLLCSGATLILRALLQIFVA